MNYFVNSPITDKHHWMPRTLPEASAYTDKAIAERRAKLAMQAFNIDLSHLEHDLRQLGISLKDALLAYSQQANAQTEKGIEERYAALLAIADTSRGGSSDTLQLFLDAVADVMTSY